MVVVNDSGHCALETYMCIYGCRCNCFTWMPSLAIGATAGLLQAWWPSWITILMVHMICHIGSTAIVILHTASKCGQQCTLPPNVQNCVAAGLMTPLSSLLGARSSLGLSSRLGSCAPSGHHGPMSMHGCLMQWLMTPHIGSKWLSLSQAKWIFPHGPAIGWLLHLSMYPLPGPFGTKCSAGSEPLWSQVFWHTTLADGWSLPRNLQFSTNGSYCRQ